MDLNDLHPPDDYSHRFFIWHEWIQANGPLTNGNVFDYFATSMFYDKQSNNQVLRMQTMHTGVPLENETEELRRFTGIEFAVVHSQPPGLFIIHKRERLSPDEVRPLVAYFIMNNRIYQSPDVYSLVSNRLLTSLQALQTSLDILRSHRPSYTPRTGFVWPIVESTDPLKRAEETNDERPATQGAESQSQDRELSPTQSKRAKAASSNPRQQNVMLLVNAIRTTALHATESFTLPTAVPTESTPAVPEGQTPGAGPGPTPGARSAAATPAPATRGATPVGNKRAGSPLDREPTKGQPGAGKKKKRRTATLNSVTS
ncbi:hypothetical protein FOMPIDRAFT_1031010 [Fomitopsis schrenkii]|uniref:Mediator of RNA polymerase II transcription subunit 6 n=1 Tax=Fomitopsis schrenkii TaxID=2126942 RepID=S8FLA2_FOMSC|nr:hypothetical protein FOMPIDRAFT_1031010 [Fomitopsis schrenkii]